MNRIGSRKQLSSLWIWVRAIAVPLAVWALAGCGGSADEEEAPCGAPQLASLSAHPLDEIAIEGIPAHFSGHLAARVTADGASSHTLIARQVDGPTVLVAPIHPTGSAAGGQVLLEVVDAEGRVCAPVPFTILPLAPAPGATEEVLDLIHGHQERQAGFFGTTIEALRATPLEELPDHLLPLYLAQYALDAPDNPNSLRALLDGSAPDLDGVSADRDLLDKLLHHVGLPAALEESLEELDALLAAGEGDLLAMRSATIATAGGPTNAFQLHTEMELARWGRAHVDGARGKVVRDTAKLVGLAGLLPAPQAKVGSMIAGSTLFSFTLVTDAMAYLLPSRFSSIEFQHDPPTFREDDPNAGTWYDVRVVAESEGWKLDKAILDTLLQLVNVRGGYKEWLTAFAPKGFREALAGHLQNEAVSKAIQVKAGGSGIVTLPPQKTRPIDVTEEPWSFATFHFALKGEEERQRFRLDPEWEGDLEAEIEIGTAVDKFGGLPISKSQPFPIAPVTIVAEPRQASVDPGEAVEFTITVLAYDPSISVRAEHGSVALEALGEGVWLVRYTAPPTEAGLPDLIVVESESTTGLLANPDRGRPSIAIPIRGSTPWIVVTPQGVCVELGEKEAFQAEVFNLETQDVHWSASAGTITEEGVFTAPDTSGPVDITATSVEDESVQGAASIRVGGCGCNWTATLSGPVSHTVTNDSQVLTLGVDDAFLNLQLNGPVGQHARDILLISPREPIASGATGGYLVTVSGTYAASGHAFVSAEGALQLDRFETHRSGSEVTASLAGAVSAEVWFSSISGEPVHEIGEFRLEFEGTFDTTDPMGWLHCAGYGKP